MATVDVRCTLDQDPARYSLQEDVLLQVVLSNQGKAPAETPYLLQSDEVTLRLKGPGTGPLRESKTRVPRPGVMVPSDVYALAPNQDVEYALPLAVWFGPLRPGKYEVQLEIESPAVDHTTAWWRFEVDPLAAAHPTVVPATSGGTSELTLLWFDDNATPPKLLCRNQMLDHGGAIMTVALADVGVGSRDLTTAVAPPDRAGAQQWILWAEGSELCYALKEDRTLGPVFRHAMGEDATLLGPALSAPDPTTDETGFSLLCRSSSRSGFLGLEIDARGAVTSTHRASLDGEAGHVAVVYPAEDSRWVVWTQNDQQGDATVRVMPWSRADGFGKSTEIGRIDSSVWSLDAKAIGQQFWVSAVTVTDDVDDQGSPRRVGRLVTIEGKFARGGIAFEDPVTRRVQVARDVTDARLATSDDGSPWLLLRKPRGAEVVGWSDGEMGDPFSIDVESLDAWLAVGANEVPTVVSLNADRGWGVTIAVPNAGAH